jgi:hypothetical protein
VANTSYVCRASLIVNLCPLQKPLEIYESPKTYKESLSRVFSGAGIKDGVPLRNHMFREYKHIDCTADSPMSNILQNRADTRPKPYTYSP